MSLTNRLTSPTSLTGTSIGDWEDLGTDFFTLGNGFILILRSSMVVSPFSSPTSAGSLEMATSSSCLSRGKYSGSNLDSQKINLIRVNTPLTFHWCYIGLFRIMTILHIYLDNRHLGNIPLIYLSVIWSCRAENNSCYFIFLFLKEPSHSSWLIMM